MADVAVSGHSGCGPGRVAFGTARAQDIDVLGDPVTNTITLGGFDFLGQTVTVPAGQGRIVEIRFRSFDADPARVFRANIYAWDAANMRATGPALFVSSDLTTTSNQIITVATGDVPVTPGEDYVLFLEATGGSGTVLLGLNNNERYTDGGFQGLGAGTPTGSTWFPIGPGHDLSFAVDFEPPVPPIPTLTEWAMILLTLMLASAGAVMLQQRHRVGRNV